MYIIVKDYSSDFKESAKTSYSTVLQTYKKLPLFIGVFSDDYSKIINQEHIDEFIKKLALKTKAPITIDKNIINYLSVRRRKRSSIYREGKSKIDNFLQNIDTSLNRQGLISSYNHLLRDDYVCYYLDVESLPDDLSKIDLPLGEIEGGKLAVIQKRKLSEHSQKLFCHVFVID